MQALEGKPLTVSNLQTEYHGFVNDKSEISRSRISFGMYIILVSINKKRNSNYLRRRGHVSTSWFSCMLLDFQE